MESSSTLPCGLVLEEKRLGWVKTFSTVKGYGFVVDLETGRECFVHHHDLARRTPGFRAIWRGEYVEFLPEETERGTVARAVTGIRGGPLFCEISSGAEPLIAQPPPPTPNA